jgi:hypothetical protein|tara:strand:+ start:705 stop:1181 length:477 start_codon:yes stop_codon:yes gene_type:complete
MYTLYSDKKNIFECDIQLEGASLSQAFARVIIEGDDLNLVFNGTITNDGYCKIEMPKLNVMEGNGNMKLEVIADDMYFNPWDSDYELKKSKSVKVEVRQPTQDVITETKAKVKVNVVNEQKEVKTPIKRVVKTKKTIKESKFTKQDLKQLLLKLRSQD